MILEKLKKKVAGKKAKKQGGSVFAQRVQQSGYKAPHLGAEARKKPFWERWKKARKTTVQSPGLSGKEKTRKVLPLAGGVVIGCGIIGGLYFLFNGPLHSTFDTLRYFRIHEIEISGCRTVDKEELRKFAGMSYEMNMLSLDPDTIQERLVQHPWIKSAKVKRVWPDGLDVTVREHKPQALLAEQGGKQWRYVSSSGVIFASPEQGQEFDFPVITGFDNIKDRTVRQKLLAEANLFLRLAERNNPNLPAQNISEIHFSSGGELVLYLVEHPFPIYFGKGDVKRKYSQLRRVLEVLYRKSKGKATIENVAYIRMDYQKDKVLVARNEKG